MSKVLIVEDDPILRSAYVTVLTMEGFEVRDAPDGLEGIRLAKEIEPDIILLDMLMPNLGGVEFLRAYKLKEEHPNVKVIVFSNISVPEQMAEVMALGATRYLTKSQFTPKEMVAAIREIS
jgi:DNA-binding NarL/FixJ family response regulator